MFKPIVSELIFHHFPLALYLIVCCRWCGGNQDCFWFSEKGVAYCYCRAVHSEQLFCKLEVFGSLFEQCWCLWAVHEEACRPKRLLTQILMYSYHNIILTSLTKDLNRAVWIDETLKTNKVVEDSYKTPSAILNGEENTFSVVILRRFPVDILELNGGKRLTKRSMHRTAAHLGGFISTEKQASTHSSAFLCRPTERKATSHLLASFSFASILFYFIILLCVFYHRFISRLHNHAQLDLRDADVFLLWTMLEGG